MCRTDRGVRAALDNEGEPDEQEQEDRGAPSRPRRRRHCRRRRPLQGVGISALVRERSLGSSAAPVQLDPPNEENDLAVLYGRLSFDQGERSRWTAYAARKGITIEQLILSVFHACPTLPGDAMNDFAVAEQEKAKDEFLSSLVAGSAELSCSG